MIITLMSINGADRGQQFNAGCPLKFCQRVKLFEFNHIHFILYCVPLFVDWHIKDS